MQADRGDLSRSYEDLEARHNTYTESQQARNVKLAQVCASLWMAATLMLVVSRGMAHGVCKPRQLSGEKCNKQDPV